LAIFSVLLLLSSCDNEPDAPALIDTAPVISSSVSGVPIDNPISIDVTVTDGQDGFSSSPLSSVSVTVTNSADATVLTLNPSASGQISVRAVDTTTIANASNNLGPGDYTVAVRAEDTKGNVSTDSTSFTVLESEFMFVQTQMFILGSFNGWGGTDNEMTLVADHTWEDTDVTVTTGDQFKFANTSDFSDTDWTDRECDGTAEEATGIQENIACFPFNATYTIRFNDLDLTYQLIPDIDIPTEFDNLYLLSSSNNFEGDDFQLNVLDTNVWQGSFVLNSNDLFFFSTEPNVNNMLLGDTDADGTLNEFGTVISLPPGSPSGVPYTVTVNDLTLEYSFTPDCSATIESEMYILGSMNGWGGTDLQMSMVDSVTWERDGVAILAADQFKFANTSNFTGTDWGDGECDGIAAEFGPNIDCVDSDGVYDLTFNTCTVEYTIQ
jgi:hypothetical protein